MATIATQFWGANQCFEREKTHWNHYSNISLNPAGENNNMAAITKRILSTTSECDAISLSGGLDSHETP